jgi:hypothetical protein
MMNKSTLRLAATAMAIACAAAADAQQAEAPAFAVPAVDAPYVPETRLAMATEPGAPPEAVAKIVFDEPAATSEQPVEPVRLAQATPAAPVERTAPPARLPDTAGWAPLLVLLGLVAFVGALVLMMRRRMRRSPARGPHGRLAAELKALWDKTTTTETLRPRG